MVQTHGDTGGEGDGFVGGGGDGLGGGGLGGGGLGGGGLGGGGGGGLGGGGDGLVISIVSLKEAEEENVRHETSVERRLQARTEN